MTARTLVRTGEKVERGERFVARRAAAWTAAAAGAPRAATPVLDLAADELERRAAPHIVQATLTALDQGATHYPDRTGIEPLRAAVAARFATEDGLAYDPNGEILITGGAHEGLFVATQMLIEDGDEVIVQDPAPAAYGEGVRLAGGVPVLAPTSAADRYALTAAAVAARITPRTRALIFGSPAAPTGGVTPRAELLALAELVRAYDLTVLLDETYRPFIFDDAEWVNFATLPGMRERTVLVGSFSTRYAMAGWRAGYLAGVAANLKPVTHLKQSLTICSPALAQWAALAALEGPQAEPADAVRAVAARRAVAIPALAAMNLPAGGAQGTHYLFADVSSTGLTGRAFAEVALRDAEVRVLPGDVYGANWAGYVRLSLVAPETALREALGRLAPVVQRLQREAVATSGAAWKGGR
ncbi:MAG: pyridoxal phosphate-dependent aminotransferase [Thermomicrobiales bacterium]